LRDLRFLQVVAIYPTHEGDCHVAKSLARSDIM
jgi:hypothetical protein